MRMSVFYSEENQHGGTDQIDLNGCELYLDAVSIYLFYDIIQ